MVAGARRLPPGVAVLEQVRDELLDAVQHRSHVTLVVVVRVPLHRLGADLSPGSDLLLFGDVVPVRCFDRRSQITQYLIRRIPSGDLRVDHAPISVECSPILLTRITFGQILVSLCIVRGVEEGAAWTSLTAKSSWGCNARGARHDRRHYGKFGVSTPQCAHAGPPPRRQMRAITMGPGTFRRDGAVTC